MTSVLEVALTLVGVMLVLAMVAESLQELLKSALAIKGQAALQALRRLVTEAARSQDQTPTDAEEIVTAIQTRLRSLGQSGIRPNAVRLDAMSAPKLGELIQQISPDDVSSLRKISRDEANHLLTRIAQRAVTWYPLAFSPVDDRYRRRMRVLAVVSSTVVVLGVNAAAFDIVKRARDDPEYRRQVSSLVATLDTLQRQAAAATPATSDTTGRGAVTTAASRRAQIARDSVGRVLQQAQGWIGGPAGWRPGDYVWWAGILLSIALVSLGAPFWHDALEAIFGVKARIRAQVRNLERTTQEPTPVILPQSAGYVPGREPAGPRVPPGG